VVPNLYKAQFDRLSSTSIIPSNQTAMSFLKRNGNKPLIPPVGDSQDTISRPGGNNSLPRRPNTKTYIASRDGDLSMPSNSRSNSGTPSSEDAYAPRDKSYRNAPIGDVYTRGGAKLDNDRNELFAGLDPSKTGSGRFFDGPGLGREPPPGEENDEDVEGIKNQTRFIKQDSVQSSRNALRLAREAEETARSTLLRLGDQSGQLMCEGSNYLLIFQIREIGQHGASPFRSQGSFCSRRGQDERAQTTQPVHLPSGHRLQQRCETRRRRGKSTGSV